MNDEPRNARKGIKAGVPGLRALPAAVDLRLVVPSKVSLAVLFLAWPTRGAAQSAALAPAEVVAPTCGSPSMLIVDTAGFVLSLDGATVAGDSSIRVLSQLEAQAVADNFRRPSRLTWPRTWIPTLPAQRPGDSTEAGGLSGRLALRVDRRGHLIDVALVDSTDLAELNASLLAAVLRADSTGTLAPTLGRDSIAAVTIRVSADRALDPRAAPLMRVKVPYTRITTGAAWLRPAPFRFPKGVDRPMDVVVELQYVIGEDGRAIPSSVWLLKSNHAEFVAPVVEAVLNSEFRPARSGACPVKQLVQQRIGFRVRFAPGHRAPSIQATPEPPVPRDPAPPFHVRE